MAADETLMIHTSLGIFLDAGMTPASAGRLLVRRRQGATVRQAIVTAIGSAIAGRHCWQGRWWAPVLVANATAATGSLGGSGPSTSRT